MTRAKSKTRKTSAASAAAAPAPARAEPSLPGGKLGLIIQRLGAKTGATADELAKTTGWQRHTVHGALSRLRTRGFAIRVETEGERRAYHLARAEG